MSIFQSFWRDSGTESTSGTSSLIPLPTVSTLLEKPKPSSSSPSRQKKPSAYDPSDPYLPLQRAENALQRQIQEYLDAQLFALFPNEQNSATPATRKLPGRPASLTGISLADARLGITKAMQSLAQVKVDQASQIRSRSKALEAASSQVQSWDQKEASLRAEMHAAREASDDDDWKQLNDENRSLQDQINDTELKLSELRSQQRAVQLRLSERDNALNSRIASYRQAEALVERERRAFLKSPPADLFRSAPDAAFFQLKRDRRTTQMAVEALAEADKAERRNLDSTKVEQEALEEGVKIWSEIVDRVMQMEGAIRSELKELSSNTDDPSRAQSSMHHLRQQLDSDVDDLEKELHDAEAKGRSLLVCCIGAELEALQNGQKLLQQVAAAAAAGQPEGAASRGANASAKDPEVISSPPESTAPDSPAHEYKGPLLSGTASNTDESDADPENLLIARRDTDDTD